MSLHSFCNVLKNQTALFTFTNQRSAAWKRMLSEQHWIQWHWAFVFICSSITAVFSAGTALIGSGKSSSKPSQLYKGNPWRSRGLARGKRGPALPFPGYMSLHTFLPHISSKLAHLETAFGGGEVTPSQTRTPTPCSSSFQDTEKITVSIWQKKSLFTKLGFFAAKTTIWFSIE